MVCAQKSRYFQSFSVPRPFKKSHPYQRLGSGCSAYTEPHWGVGTDRSDSDSESQQEQEQESVKYYTYTYNSESKSSKIKASLTKAGRSVKGAARVVRNLAVDVLVVSVVCVGYVVGGLVQGLVR